MIFINQVLDGGVEDDVNTEDNTFQHASWTPHPGFIAASSEVLQGRTQGSESWSLLAPATPAPGTLSAQPVVGHCIFAASSKAWSAVSTPVIMHHLEGQRKAWWAPFFTHILGVLPSRLVWFFQNSLGWELAVSPNTEQSHCWNTEGIIRVGNRIIPMGNQAGEWPSGFSSSFHGLSL